MERDIVVVREGNSYRLVHGHLRLANTLKADGEAWVQLSGGDRVRIIQAADGYRVAGDVQQLPLLCL